MEYKDRLSLDNKNEKSMCAVLDKYLYSKDIFSATGRAETYQEQAIDGIDVYFTASGHSFQCDEKTALWYANKNLQTFALELTSYSPNKHCRFDGWYINPNKKADSYLFVYLNKCDGTIETFSSGDVREIEVILVSKDRIDNYLTGLGYTKERLKEISDSIVYNNTPYWNYNDGDIRFHYSYQYEEKTVNVLVKRDVLRKLSNYNEVIRTK